MGSWQQRRRRREIERRLRELDRLDRDRAVRGYTRPHRPRRLDRTTLVALVVTVTAFAGLVYVDPSVLPLSLRNAVGVGPKRVAAPVATGAKGSYAFIAHQSGDANKPVAWDPCRPIRYEINPSGGPSGAVELTRQAVSRAEQVSGLAFDYVGETDARPHWDTPMLPVIAARRPVLVSWADETEVPQLHGDVAGIGGSVPIDTRLGQRRYATGGVTLDSASYLQLDGRPDGKAEERAILLHELGHLLGLAHVSDPSQLMYKRNLGLLDYGPGDLAGLAMLGRGQCF